MERILRERDLLLQRTARVFGHGFTGLALLLLALPGAMEPGTLLLTLPLFGVLAYSQYRISIGSWLTWAVVTNLSAIAIVLLVSIRPQGETTLAGMLAAAQLAGGSTSSIAGVMKPKPGRIAVVGAAFLLSIALVLFVTAGTGYTPALLAFVLFVWTAAFLVGSWLSASLRRASRRIANIGRAHRTERQASETEAQRRQGARLLHDTVLATLTLLAHSGYGVSEGALRQQAADDARLLRQLRLGATPAPQASGGYTLEPVTESVLGNTLENVKQRFGRMGLEVSWHGTGQVLLPSEILDAFLLSLAECLENVRRHSGVTVAHVTITDDDTTVRAMVTDSGVGFEIGDIDTAKLGFKESVVARLRDVGGNARLFSAPGSGTTVVLEVPK
jgi:signal transduction histidine kinase